MVHGTPDWGLVGPKTTTYGLDDLGEHAVRLGSPHLFDRRGDVLLMEDFRNGLGPFEIFVNGVPGYVTLDTGHTRQGAYSVKLYAGTLLTREASIFVDLVYPTLAKLGLEFTFSLSVLTDRVEGSLLWDDGVTRYESEVAYDLPNTQLEVMDSVLGWTPFATDIDLETLEQPSNTLKFVVDVVTGQYDRCILNEMVYDLRPYTAFSGPPLTLPRLRAYVRHYAIAPGEATIYVDNVIVTQNEP